MLRFTIREVLLATAIVGLATGWWLDRTSLAAANVEAIEDARDLAFFSTPGMMRCGNSFVCFQRLRQKYGAPAFIGSDIDPYEHSQLGVDALTR